MIGELGGEVLAPLRGLLVALAGVLLVYFWYDGHRLYAAAIAIIACAVGVTLDAIGRTLLPGRPRAALLFLEGWVLTPAALAAVASAVVVLVTVALTVPDATATSTKETVGALSTGITSFLTASFVAWSGDDKNSRLSDHIGQAFRAKYNRPGGAVGADVHLFRAGSRGERWVYSAEYGGIEGWGRAARRRRAKGVSEELARGGSEPA